MITSFQETPPPHDPIIERVDVATSSSDLAWKAAGEGAPHGTGFLVAEQTAGRGRRGATWRSVRGGMYFSIVLRPGFEPRLWPGLSFIAGLAIREVIAGIAKGHAITLKWPNDVIAMKGKIGGVLLEARGDAVVVGTGVNIKPQETMPQAKLSATSMAEMGAGEVPPFEIAEAYAKGLLSRIERYGIEGFGPVRDEWLSHCAHRGEKLPGGEAVEGLFQDLDMDGAMLLDTGDATPRRITTGDVELMGRVDAACD